MRDAIPADDDGHHRHPDDEDAFQRLVGSIWEQVDLDDEGRERGDQTGGDAQADLEPIDLPLPRHDRAGSDGSADRGQADDHEHDDVLHRCMVRLRTARNDAAPFAVASTFTYRSGAPPHCPPGIEVR
ncbi:MAG: hypothetical protein K0S97_130 [Chloroflexota bacterium]|nr:hypothetical protein [Chloroflexota bacterium]